MLEQFEAERNEAAARISALELASRDGEAARSQLLRREAELKARGGATDEELEQLAEDRAMIEETLEREKETQEALAESLAEKEQRAVLMKKQLQVEDKERDEKAAEVQQRLERLLSQQEAAKEELERKLRQMEEQLLHGGMQAQNAQAQVRFVVV
jgi:chromosome segregation ATPase